jgi:hypothetical protein
MLNVFPSDKSSDTWEFQKALEATINQFPDLTVAQICGVMEIVKWQWIQRIPGGKSEDVSEN